MVGSKLVVAFIVGWVLVPTIVNSDDNRYSSPSYQHHFSTIVGASTHPTQEIDHLLALIDQRLKFAPQVAKAKWNSGAPVDDIQRESRILDEVTAQAAAMKIGSCNLRLLREFFQDQFEAGKIIQRDLILHWHSLHASNYKFDDAPDLARDIRPRLDQLTPQLIAAFCNTQPDLLQANARRYLLLQADQFIRGDVNGVARHQALRLFQNE